MDNTLANLITDEITGHFYGPDEIKSIIPLERKTSQGEYAIKLVFINELQPSVELPFKVAKQTITQEASDLTKLRDARCNPIIEDLIKILLEAEVPLDDIPHCLDGVANSIDFSNKMAQEKLFGKKLFAVTLLDIDKVLRQA